MDHHGTPLHWGYTGTNASPGWGPPQPQRAAKRALSESDDCDDVFSEESSKEHTSPGDTDSCQMLSRKKRRGVIEKKRRDRINTSLTELKRLVPSAYEKQGSAKLEKAEILQLTVDHLKTLHAKGLDTLAYDHQRFAMDYHNIGFRECAAEVARYLVSIEGMDIQDPLRLRIMSHLQCFAAQRELSAATKPPSNVSWPPLVPPPPPPSQHYETHAPQHHHYDPSCTQQHPSQQPPQPHQAQQPHQPQQTSGQQLQQQAATSVASSIRLQPQPVSAPLTALSAVGHHQYHPGQYHHLNASSFAPPASVPTSAQHLHPHQHSAYAQNPSKPYRPWGAEVAY